MKRMAGMVIQMVLAAGCLCACGRLTGQGEGAVLEKDALHVENSVLGDSIQGISRNGEVFTADTLISEVANDPVFGDYGRLIFPADAGYYSGDTLGSLRLTWYSNIDPDKTVEIANYMKEHAEAGEVIFFDIYSAEEKAADPAKEDTGLFFFKGNPGEKFAVCNAGGGFAYVAAMHDSFPHALELSKKGYHAFALIYRPGAQTACEDLARAIRFIFEHAEELEIDTDFPLGRKRRCKDGGISRKLWPCGFRRRGYAPSRHSNHAVYRSFGIYGE